MNEDAGGVCMRWAEERENKKQKTRTVENDNKETKLKQISITSAFAPDPFYLQVYFPESAGLAL